MRTDGAKGIDGWFCLLLFSMRAVDVVVSTINIVYGVELPILVYGLCRRIQRVEQFNQVLHAASGC